MTKEKPTARKMQDSLADAQRRHPKRLKKVEKARARLEKACQKLWLLENQLAALAYCGDGSPAQPPGYIGLRSATQRHAFLIFNPQSKGVQDGTYCLAAIVDCLRSYGFAVEVGMKTSGRAARALAKAAIKRGEEFVVVAAGDGTIEDVIGHLVGTKTALGIIPTGTMNNLARCLGVPLDLDDACALLAMGTLRHIDVGRVIRRDKPREGYFLETAGVGLSALATPIGQAAEKGRWELLLDALGKALSFKGANLTVVCDDREPLQLHTQVVTVSNAPLFGKNMLAAPDAKMDDGLLDVAIYEDMSKLDLERHFFAIANGKRVDNPHISFRRVRRVRITADAPLEANADLHVLPEQYNWDIDVLPGALAAAVGKGVALTLPVTAAPVVPPLTGPQPPHETSADGQSLDAEPHPSLIGLPQPE